MIICRFSFEQDRQQLECREGIEGKVTNMRQRNGHTDGHEIKRQLELLAQQPQPFPRLAERINITAVSVRLTAIGSNNAGAEPQTFGITNECDGFDDYF